MAAAHLDAELEGGQRHGAEHSWAARILELRPTDHPCHGGDATALPRPGPQPFPLHRIGVECFHGCPHSGRGRERSFPIASIAGLRGLPNSLSYVASKHAVVGMTKTAAMEYARHNIRVNAVCPVFTVTPMFQPDVMDKISEGLSRKLKSGVPMKRFAEASEMAEAILWLGSDKASFITGHALPVDGGLTA